MTSLQIVALYAGINLIVLPILMYRVGQNECPRKHPSDKAMILAFYPVFGRTRTLLRQRPLL